MRAFVIGDIHGSLVELRELIKDIDRTKTRIILCGDLIDRGLDSEGVIDFVRSNNIECVKGNHELMAEETLPSLINGDLSSLLQSDWFYNGGDNVFKQYSSRDKLATDIKWLSKLPLVIRTHITDDDGLELLVSHTWVKDSNLDRAVKLPVDFVWSRTQPGTKKNKSKYYNIYGHTPVDYINKRKYHTSGTPEVTPEPEWFDGAAAIDTGCAYNARGRGVLTGVFFPSLEVKQVKLKG